MNMNPLRWWRGRDARDADVTSADDGLRTLLSAYLDGEVNAQERSEVEAALEADPALALELAEFRAVRDTLAGLGEVRAPRSFAITAPPVAPPRGLSRLEVLTRAGASVASLAFVLLLVAGEPDLTGGVPSTVRQERARDAAGSSAGGQATSAAPMLRDSGAFTAPEAAPANAPAPVTPADEPRLTQEDARGGTLTVPEPAPKIAPTEIPALAPAAPVIAPASTPALAAAPAVATSTPPSGAAGAPAATSATPNAGSTPGVGAAEMAPVAPTGTLAATAVAAATTTAAPLDVTPVLTVTVVPPATTTPAPGASRPSSAAPAQATTTATFAPPTATAVAYAPTSNATPPVEADPSASEEAAAPPAPARPLTLVVGIMSAVLLIAAVAQWAVRTR